VVDSDGGNGIVVVTYTPNGFKLHMRKDLALPSSIKMNKRANDDTLKDMMIGAGLGAALPASSHARYELFERPAYKRQIHDLVDQARREKKLFAAPRSAGYSDWRNPLQKKMKLGDTILQSHDGYSLIGDLLKGRRPDFTTLSLGGSGGAFSHAAVSTGGGRAIDPGKTGLITFKEGLLNLFQNPTGISQDRLRELRELRKIYPRNVADSKYLSSQATDAFTSNIDRPNASVVMRPDNLSGVGKAELRRHLADIKSVGYSGPDAAAAGLKRLALPVRPGKKVRGLADLLQGTFCSHGACSVQSIHGLKTPKASEALPPDLLNTKGQSLVGIGVNRAALDAIKGSGLRGDARLAEAAKRTMLATLKRGASTRRMFAGGLTGLMAGAGALGGFIGNKAFGEE